MSSYYDDDEFGPIYRERDEMAITTGIEEREREGASLRRQREALGATPGYCRALNPTRTFMCDLPADHDGDHSGFELPTITIDE